ncbi:MAG TPA: ABC transporter ATP-binding protein [Archaeoglobus profundus]|nr:ABC transporter ATP-binding protein [Archaeoglobus profundus]
MRIENLNAGYKELQILFDINAKIERRKITTVVGPNGSGKSTLLKAIFGLATIYSGNVIFKEKDITKIPPHEKTKIGLAYLPQTNNVFTNLTVEENLKIAGYTVDKEELKSRIDLALDVFPELEKCMKKRAGTLSGGQRQFLAIATALVRNAELLMLDEPTAQLSPKYAEILFSKIVELRERLGLTILLVEQNIKKALEISDKAYMLISGRVVFEGQANELLEHEKFKQYCVGLKD